MCCVCVFVVVESEFVQNEKNLKDLQGEVDALTSLVKTYLVELRAQAKHHAECSIAP